jgi:hypothetical protein
LKVLQGKVFTPPFSLALGAVILKKNAKINTVVIFLAWQQG